MLNHLTELYLVQHLVFLVLKDSSVIDDELEVGDGRFRGEESKCKHAEWSSREYLLKVR